MIDQKNSFTIYAKILFVVLGVIIGFIVIRLFFVPVKISNSLMEPSLQITDYVWFYKTKRIESGSIVLYKSPHAGNLVSRVVAKSGETVEIINKQLYINGIKATARWKIKSTDTRFFPSRFVSRDNMNAITIPDGHIFVLNDNWDQPDDSRLFGTIPIENIVGKYAFKFSFRN
ncbi:MAG: signal peptidase I [Spirochaetes bacterium]|nr:signal peptidase I [Spirochaetota bacterium]